MPANTLTAAGSVRAFCPGSTFTLSGYTSELTDPYVLLQVIHHARNNLSADLKAQASLLNKSASSPEDTWASSYVLNSDLSLSQKTTQNSPSSSASEPEVFYRNACKVLPTSLPYRAALANGQGQRLHPKPNAPGAQTALVIGVPGQPLSSDRDHRIKVQFAWQRGGNSQSRLNHPAPEGHSGAPAADDSNASTGTWVRVATPLAPIAGANWGSVALPRIGQEVLVTFLGGDIDRPVVLAALYNGRGQSNSQANEVAAGAANATGNAPMWFPGDQEVQTASGSLPGHAHGAVLSGIKTQAMSHSQVSSCTQPAAKCPAKARAARPKSPPTRPSPWPALPMRSAFRLKSMSC